MKQGARRFPLFVLAQVGVLLAVGVALWLAYDPWRWGKLKEEVRARFPAAQRLTTTELADWQKNRRSSRSCSMHAANRSTMRAASPALYVQTALHSNSGLRGNLITRW